LAQVVDAIKRLSGVHVHSAHAQQLGGTPWAVSCGGFSDSSATTSAKLRASIAPRLIKLVNTPKITRLHV
ncbi:hypothetical protein, partial [Xylella fastidiosa]